MKMKRLLRGAKRDRGLIFLALPACAYLLIFNYVPLYGLILPFKKLDYSVGFWKSPFAGWENFRFLFSNNEIFLISTKTIAYNLVFIFVGAALSVTTALLLFELSKKVTRIYQTILFFPYFLSWGVVAYVFMSLLDMEYGIFNRLLTAIGQPGVFWYNEPQYWPVILIIVSFWKGLGNGSVIYYAAMMGFDRELYEAAKIDGASKWEQTVNISLPLLKPLIVIMVFFGIGKIFYSDFGLFYSVPLNMPMLYPTTEVMDTYVFRILRSVGDVNMSSAANFFQSVLGFVVILLSNFSLKKVDPELSIF